MNTFKINKEECWILSSGALVFYAWMVDDKYYEKLNGEIDIEAGKTYPKAFIAYRMAKDGKISYASKAYQKYNTLIKY